jgi:hypothetical protein
MDFPHEQHWPHRSTRAEDGRRLQTRSNKIGGAIEDSVSVFAACSGVAAR